MNTTMKTISPTNNTRWGNMPKGRVRLLRLFLQLERIKATYGSNFFAISSVQRRLHKLAVNGVFLPLARMLWEAKH